MSIANDNTHIDAMASDAELSKKINSLYSEFGRYRYSYNFSWLDIPIIQLPQDVITMQELIWRIKPDLIIETGIAHGGSLVFSASMLELLDICCGKADKKRMVLGIDIDIRSHNRVEIEKHPMSHRIKMIEGSSIDPDIVKQVQSFAANHDRILVCLDSMHTHDHVLEELYAYAPLVSKGSYCVVFDTVIEDMPENSFPDRPWDKGNNPKTAVWSFLEEIKNSEKTIVDKAGMPIFFEIDRMIENKLLITVAPDGYLKRVL